MCVVHAIYERRIYLDYAASSKKQICLFWFYFEIVFLFLVLINKTAEVDEVSSNKIIKKKLELMEFLLEK